MSEESKSIWNRPCRWAALAAWLLVTVTVLWFACLRWAQADHHGPFSGWLLGAWVHGAALFATCLLFSYAGWRLLALLLRHWRRTLLGLVSFAGLVALFYAVENWRGSRAWENLQREAAARGESFDLQSVVPPALPDGQNFALTPIAASTYRLWLTRDGKLIPYEQRDTNLVNRLALPLTRRYSDAPTNGVGNWQKAVLTDLAPWQAYYRKLAATTNLFPVAPQPRLPAADVLLALSKYDPTVEELRTAAALPGARFPLEYDKDCPAAILLPHLASLKPAAQFLQLRALAELQNGEAQKALDDVRLILRLADSISAEPFYISHLVRLAILQIGLQPVYEGLAAQRWTDAQLAELDRALAREDFVAGYRAGMRGEMVFQYRDIEYVRRHPRELNNFSGFDEDGSPAVPPFPRWLILAGCFYLNEAHCVPAGWYYQNEVRCARLVMDHYLPIADVGARTISPAKAKAAEAAFQADVQRVTPYNYLERLLLPGLGNIALKFARGQASVDLARVAVALERYRLAHGGFPEALDGLAPQYLTAVPRDVINGRPLTYRREAASGFVLYSVGWNETDDGGAVVLGPGSSQNVDPKAGDWVWRYPSPPGS
jgi:hypothetical protein